MKKYPSVILQAQAVRRIAGRYPFGHSGDIASNDAGIAAGEVVQVKEPNGKFVGLGYFNANGATPLRMLSWQQEDINIAFYRRRVEAALAKRKALQNGTLKGTNAMRMLHAEADGLPGVIADQFADVLSVQLRNAGVERHREQILKVLKDLTGATSAFERSDSGERRKEGLNLVSGPLWGELPEKVSFFEDDLNLYFAPMDARKNWLFS